MPFRRLRIGPGNKTLFTFLSFLENNRIPSLVYTEAVLIETLRLANVAPLTLMHCASKDTQLRGFNVPKVHHRYILIIVDPLEKLIAINFILKLQGSLVMINLYSVQMDETYWADPEVFRPERHLDADGLKVKKSERLMSFGLGNKAENVMIVFIFNFSSGGRYIRTFVIG